MTAEAIGRVTTMVDAAASHIEDERYADAFDFLVDRCRGSVSINVVRDYGLEPLGYSLRPRTAAQWTGALEAAIAENR
jgi:hypothetical protein